MKIITVKYNKFIDKDLRDYINKIWLTYDRAVPKDSSIYFMKNTTIPRLVTDYTGTGISRVIKKENADYMIIDKLNIGTYPQYYDEITSQITTDDSKTPVWGIYNLTSTQQDTIAQILEFINLNKHDYVNQVKLNESLNNGFIISNDNYHVVKELLDSGVPENEMLAIGMLVKSDLKANLEWILWLLYGKYRCLQYDKSQIIQQYLDSHLTGKGITYQQLTNTNWDSTLKLVQNPDIRQHILNSIRAEFNKSVQASMNNLCKTNLVELEDFKLTFK